MTEKNHEQPWYGAHGYNEESHDESPSAPDESPSHGQSWSMAQPKVSYGVAGHVSESHKVVKKTTKVYKPSYTTVKHSKHYSCAPIVCDPQYVIHDHFIPREVPVIHPIIHVHRHNIVNVPKHYYKTSSKDVVLDPSAPIQP